MKPPVHRLKKSEIIWLNKNHCVAHGHSYLSHYSCYLNEAPNRTPRIGFWDIETTNLDADFGIMLAWNICEKGKVTFGDVITLHDIDSAQAGDEDARIVASCVNALGQFDKIVTWYGQRFDMPFTRTRALICGVPFPYYGSISHQDIYFASRSKLKLSSNRLENVCRSVLDKTQKTRIEKRLWRAAGRGDAKALEYVSDHCKKDVLDLEKIYYKLIDFTARRDTSL